MLAASKTALILDVISALSGPDFLSAIREATQVLHQAAAAFQRDATVAMNDFTVTPELVLTATQQAEYEALCLR